MTAIRLICPTGQNRTLPDLDDLEAVHGEILEVPDDLAGRPPRSPSGTPGEDDYDPGDLGEGLLAQYQVWGPADITVNVTTNADPSRIAAAAAKAANRRATKKDGEDQ